MIVYRVTYGHYNGADGTARSYFSTKEDARAEVSRLYHEKLYDPNQHGGEPELTELRFEGFNRKAIASLLNRETEALSS